MATQINTKALAAQVRKAAIEAVDETLDEAAQQASSRHWWHARHGRRGLAGQVKVDRARVEGGKVTGGFGSTAHKGFYGLILERRNPWLRPVADRVFPGVSDRIRRRLG